MTKFCGFFLIRALAHDARYNVTVNFLNRDDESLDGALIKLTSAASTIEASSPANPQRLQGNVAVSKRDHKSKNPCFAFQRNGRCRRGAKCPFMHVRGEEHKNEPFSDQARRPSRGKCLECGSTDHGVDDCPVFRQRHEAMASVKASLAQAAAVPPVPQPAVPSAEMLQRQALQAQAASVSAPVPALNVGYDPVIMAALNAASSGAIAEEKRDTP